MGLVPSYQVPPATALQPHNKPFLIPERWDQSFQGIHEEEGVPRHVPRCPQTMLRVSFSILPKAS